MGIIRKVHPTDIELIKHIYSIIISLERIEYKHLTFETFMECRDSIYIYIDKCYEFSEYPSIDGIIVCRRTDIDTNYINKLLYYCQPNKIMYSIEAFYIFECSDDEKYKYIAKQLLEVCCIDKNDAFISIRLSSLKNVLLEEYITNELILHNFYNSSYDECIHTYIKPPTTIINYNN